MEGYTTSYWKYCH